MVAPRLSFYRLLFDIYAIFPVFHMLFVSSQIPDVSDMWCAVEFCGDVPGSHAGKQTSDQVRSKIPRQPPALKLKVEMVIISIGIFLFD